LAVKASEEEIACRLEGNWQEDLLFVLQQEQDGYEFCQKQMAECDQRLQQYLQGLADRSHGAGLPKEKRKERLRKKKKGNAPQFDLRAELFRLTGTDLTQIDGIDVTTTLTILSEAGWDRSSGRQNTILFPGCGCVQTIASAETKSLGKADCQPTIESRMHCGWQLAPYV
jgi:hypothetical protein